MLPSLMAALLLLSCACGENPAIQVILTDKGLQYAKHAVAGWVQEKLQTITLPDISGEVYIPICSMHYSLTGIKIAKCDFPEPSVQFYEDTSGFKAILPGLSVALTGGWTVTFAGLQGGGSFTMAVFGLDVVSVVKLGRDAEGRLSVASVQCEAQVQSVDVQLEGKASWIVQRLVDHFKSHVQGDIESRICTKLEKSIDNLEHHLQALNVSFNVSEVLSLDLPLSGSPVVNATSLNLGLKGEFYNIETHEEPPMESQPFTVPLQPDYMLSVGLSDYTLNSASFGYFSAGLLQTNITDNMIPPGSPVRLNTTSMGQFIPQLLKMFPDLLMELQVYAREFPMFSFQPAVVKLNVSAGAKAFAIQPNGTQTPLFTLNVDSTFSGKIWIAGDRVKGSMTMDNLTLTLAASEVGPFATDSLQKTLIMGMKMGVLPWLNKILDHGINLPKLKHGELVNSVLQMEKGFIAVSSDAQMWQANQNFL